MNGLDQIMKDKSTIREALKANNANGINGAGIDPIEKKLLIFVSSRERAKETLRILLGESFSDSVILRKLNRYYLQPPARFKQVFLCSTEEPIKDVVSLAPSSSSILPQCGSKGLPGCFVSFKSLMPAVLTAEHIFYRRGQHAVYLTPDSYTVPILAGTSKDYRGLKPAPETSSVDCAIFSPSANITLSRSHEVTGNHTKRDDLPMTTKIFARRVGSESRGQILDTDVIIKYGAVLDEEWQEVLLDGQILIRSANRDFGRGGDSGSLVVIDENIHPFHKGDGLGLYVAFTASREYHFVTPLHSCLDAVGATGIYNPPVLRRETESGTSAFGSSRRSVATKR